MPESGQFIPDKATAVQHDPHYLATTYACGERGDHVAEIERSKWPPVPLPGLNDAPFVPATCKRCGVNLIVYNPPAKDLTVVLIEDRPPESGDRPATAGKVVDIKDWKKPGGKVLG